MAISIGKQCGPRPILYVRGTEKLRIVLGVGRIDGRGKEHQHSADARHPSGDRDWTSPLSCDTDEVGKKSART